MYQFNSERKFNLLFSSGRMTCQHWLHEWLALVRRDVDNVVTTEQDVLWQHVLKDKMCLEYEAEWLNKCMELEGLKTN